MASLALSEEPAKPATGVLSDEPTKPATGVLTPDASSASISDGILEVVQPLPDNMAGSDEHLPRQDMPASLTAALAKDLARMSDEFAQLRQDMAKRIKDLEKELGREMQKTKDEANRQLAQQVHEQHQQRATLEHLQEETRQIAMEAQQMATRDDLALNQQQVAKQVQQMATRPGLAETEQKVKRLQLSLGGVLVLLVALAMANYFISSSSDGHLCGNQNHTILSSLQMKQADMWSISTSVLPLNISMKEFKKHQNSKGKWESDPFYTHFRGYKMCLRVWANGHGDGTGTHVSVSVVLMRGEFDKELSWPFRGSVRIRLLSVSETPSNLVIVNFSEATGNISERVTLGESAPEGWGFSRYVYHTELPQFLSNDSILLEVAIVELPENIMPLDAAQQFVTVKRSMQTMWSMLTNALPLNITMDNFTQHRNSKQEWYSEPFYTHFHGYKMCLCVDANGRGDGAGTHVSVFVHLMHGEFDDQLSWPFRGTIQIRLLTLSEEWQKLQNLDFNLTTDGSNQQVFSGERSPHGWGHHTYISHNELESHVDKQNDSITFHVSLVELPADMHGPLSISQHTSVWSMLTNILPLNITMTNFTAYNVPEKRWSSRPFYTHFHGYRMCVGVYANGNNNGTGTHVSVFFYLMRGEFDHKLTWPYQGTIQINVLSQSGELQKTLDIGFKDANDGRNERIVSGERGRGWGTPTYIGHNELELYLDTRKDSITFQVAAVKLSDGIHSPLVMWQSSHMWSMLTNILPLNISMTQFRRRLTWYSEPFYTHFQGYKICLRVDANGVAYGAGTHVSVSIYLMRGEFDDKLNWPYQNTIQISVLSLEGELEKVHDIDFKEATDGNNERVLSGEMGLGWGPPMYVPHTELKFYVDERKDSITFQLVEVKCSHGR